MLSASWWFLYQKDVPRKLAFFITNLYCILETAFPYLYPLILKIRWTQNPLLSLFNKWREARPRNLCISHSPTWSSCLVIQVCPTLSDPKDCSLSGSSVHGILQARILVWVAISFSRRSSRARDQTLAFYIAGRFFICWAIEEAPPQEGLALNSGLVTPKPRTLFTSQLDNAQFLRAISR